MVERTLSLNAYHIDLPLRLSRRLFSFDALLSFHTHALTHTLSHTQSFSHTLHLGIVGLKDPLREGVVEAVHRIRNSGAKVRFSLLIVYFSHLSIHFSFLSNYFQLIIYHQLFMCLSYTR